MAVIFSKISGENDGLWKDIERALMAIMQDTDSEKNNDDEIVKLLYTVKTSKKFAEKTTGLTEFSDFSIVGEGEAAPLDNIQEGFSKLITHHQFLKKFVCTAEMAEDMNLDEMKLASANFMRAYKRSRANFASSALVQEGSTFSFGSSALDKTTGDGLGLFSTAHKGKKSGVSTQSNVFTNTFGADTTMLNRLANTGRNFRNDSGEVQGYTFDTIIVPSNTPELEDTVKRIIRSDLLVGSDFNDVNTQKGLWKLVVNHRWQAGSGKNPYILMSSEANKELMGSVFFDRVGLKVMNDIDLDTHNLEWSGRCRFSAGFNNWRHVILGGADAGTTLT